MNKSKLLFPAGDVVLSKKDKRTEKKEKLEARLRKEEIEKQVQEIIGEYKPADIRTLVELVEEKYETPQDEVLKILREKEQKKEITLQEPIVEPTSLPKNLKEYFFKKNYFSIEFWTVIITICLVAIFVFVNVETGFFFILRYIVVSFFMLILSGWTLTAAIFPELNDNFRFLERAATAIGFSIVILVVDGLFLNYTFHFNPVSIGVSLIIITIIPLVIAIGLRMKLSRDGYIFKRKEDEPEEEIIEG